MWLTVIRPVDAPQVVVSSLKCSGTAYSFYSVGALACTRKKIVSAASTRKFSTIRCSSNLSFLCVPTDCTEICETNAICDGEDCVCDEPFFSPTGSNTDCRSRSGKCDRCQLTSSLLMVPLFFTVPDPLCSDPMCIFCGAASNQPCMW